MNLGMEAITELTVTVVDRDGIRHTFNKVNDWTLQGVTERSTLPVGTLRITYSDRTRYFLNPITFEEVRVVGTI